jgi:hypothetical protein
MRCKMNEERKRIAELLKRFLNGTAAEWEFDTFLSSRHGEPDIEKYRIELAELPNLYPPQESSHYVSKYGVARIRDIIGELDSKL